LAVQATQGVGHGLDGALALLLPLVDNPATHPEASPEREAVLAALNGVLGDRLHSAGNPLAQVMALFAVQPHGGGATAGLVALSVVRPAARQCHSIRPRAIAPSGALHAD